MRWPSSPQPGSKLLGARYQTVRSKQAVGETPRSKSEVLAPRLSEGEARLTSDRGAARNPYLGGVTTARESSPAQETRVGSGTGIKPYNRADPEERAAAAGAVATSDGAVDPRRLGGHPPAPVPPRNDRDASVGEMEGVPHRDNRMPLRAEVSSHGPDDYRRLCVGHFLGGDGEGGAPGPCRYGDARGHRRRSRVVAGQVDSEAAGGRGGAESYASGRGVRPDHVGRADGERGERCRSRRRRRRADRAAGQSGGSGRGRAVV